MHSTNTPELAKSNSDLLDRRGFLNRGVKIGVGTWVASNFLTGQNAKADLSPVDTLGNYVQHHEQGWWDNSAYAGGAAQAYCSEHSQPPSDSDDPLEPGFPINQTQSFHMQAGAWTYNLSSAEYETEEGYWTVQMITWEDGNQVPAPIYKTRTVTKVRWKYRATRDVVKVVHTG